MRDQTQSAVVRLGTSGVLKGFGWPGMFTVEGVSEGALFFQANDGLDASKR